MLVKRPPGSVVLTPAVPGLDALVQLDVAAHVLVHDVPTLLAEVLHTPAVPLRTLLLLAHTDMGYTYYTSRGVFNLVGI